MLYRVMRREYVKKRPEWMTRFLLTMSPVIYESHPTEEEAMKVLEGVKQKITDFGLNGYRSHLKRGGLVVTETPKGVYITNKGGKSLLRFRVEKE